MNKTLLVTRWAVDLQQWKPTIHELCLAISSIQPEEKERLMKFVFREDFDSSLVGRLLMRKFIKTVTNIPYENIFLERDKHGKPYLTNSLDENRYISFNVSHQGRYSVLAGVCYNNKLLPPPITASDVFDNIDVGVDVMKIEYTGGKSLSEFFRIMNRNFSADEWNSIKNHSNESDQLKSFMRHWCLKESYVKNVGVGITVDLRNVSFKVKSELALNRILTDSELRLNGKLLDNWKFEEHFLDQEHNVAIAFKNWNNKIESGSFNLLNSKELLEDCVPSLDNDEVYCQKVFDKDYKTKIK